ncbi:MAG TPA: DUF1572 family protein [Acidobacteriota bacterium]|nr:DUF1572 family protein [Acidobacteriota bacterium]
MTRRDEISVMQARNRQLAHYASHAGQILLHGQAAARGRETYTISRSRPRCAVRTLATNDRRDGLRGLLRLHRGRPLRRGRCGDGLH